MQELNNKKTKLISGGVSTDQVFTLGLIVGAGVFCTALYAFAKGGEKALKRLQSEKKIKGDHVIYLDSELDAELAALNYYYKKKGGRDFQIQTNEKFEHSSDPKLER